MTEQAENFVEKWHKKNNWVPTERSVLPALDAYDAGYTTKESEVEALLAGLKSCLMTYQEYFHAIERGDYIHNKRPGPLREYEMILLADTKEKLKALRGEK